MAKLQIYQDMAIISLRPPNTDMLGKESISPRNSQEALWRHWKDPQLRWTNLSTGQLLVVHSTNLVFIEVWQEESHKKSNLQFATSHVVKLVSSDQT